MALKTRTGVAAAAVLAGVGLAVGGITLLDSTEATPDPAPPKLARGEVNVVPAEAGGFTPFLPTNCNVEVSSTDTTPSKPEAYTVALTSQEAGGGGEFKSAVVKDDTVTFTVPCDNLEAGAEYQMQVDEAGSGTTEAKPFVFEVTAHPSGITATSDKVKGVEGFTPGKPVTVSFEEGVWEEGTVFSTRVWVSKTPKFTDADYLANSSGGAQLVGLEATDAPVMTFTPPTTAQGMYVWYSLVGQAPGKAPYRFTFSGVPVHKLPAMPAGWVQSFGEARTEAATGKPAEVSPVQYSAEGEAQDLKVEYQWFVSEHTQAIPGATEPSYTVGEQYTGYDLAVRVTVSSSTRAPRTTWIEFGTVK